jgi:hypothetical protein
MPARAAGSAPLYATCAEAAARFLGVSDTLRVDDSPQFAASAEHVDINSIVVIPAIPVVKAAVGPV